MFSYNAWWGSRTPDERSEIIPSSRITPDPSDSQIHDGASSVHSLIFYRVQVREHLTRDQRHSFIQNHSRSFRFTDPWRCFFSSPHSCSTGFRSEDTWREIRDHSFIQNHSRPFRFTDPWRCFFSSPHSSSTGFRSEDTWREIRDIPSSRITPDPSDSQIHDGASSVHSLMFYRVQVRGLGWPAEAWCCAQWPIFVVFLRFVFGLLYGWKIQTWPIIIFITESVTYWFFYLLVFDRIHDAMCLKTSRTSSRNIAPQHQKYSSIFHCTHDGVLLSLCSPNSSWVFAFFI